MRKIIILLFCILFVSGTVGAWGTGGFPSPIGDSGQATYNPIQKSISQPDAGTAVSNNPYGSGVPVVAPAPSTSSGSSSSSNYVPPPIPTPAQISIMPVIGEQPTPKPTIPPYLLITPNPTPVPTIEPSSELKAAMALAELPKEEIKPASTPQRIQWATLNLTTSPSNSTVYVNEQRVGQTPWKRDYTPGGWNFRVVHEGYNNVSFRIVFRDGDIKNIALSLNKTEVVFENFSTENITEIPQEKSDNFQENKLSFSPPLSQPDNMTALTNNDTNDVKNMNMTAMTILVIFVLVAVFVYWRVFHSNRRKTPDTTGAALSDDGGDDVRENDTENDTENEMSLTQKIKIELEKNPELSNAELAELFGVSERTIYRNK